MQPRTPHHALEAWLAHQEAQGLRRVVVPSLDVLRQDSPHDFASNDYLSFARMGVDAPDESVTSYYYGAGSARLVVGTHQAVLALEERIAEWKGTEASVIFPTGFQANISAIPALVYPHVAGMPSKEVWFFSDKLCHASLNEGCRLATLEGALWKRYRHNDLIHLERMLQHATQETRTRGVQHPLFWIVTESVFSMDGDTAPLEALCELADRYGALMYLDEAHATGVMGTHGQGLAHVLHCNRFQCLAHGIHMGTFSKALGCVGGYVTGSKLLMALMWQRAKGLIYTTALPPRLITHLHHVLDRLQAQPSKPTPSEVFQAQLKHFLSLWEPFRKSSPTHQGYFIPESWFHAQAPHCYTPIVPLYAPDIATLLHDKARLEEAGFLVGAIRPPTVPHGTQRLRISLHTHNTYEALEALLAHLIRQG
ncbi:MAG: aminotransferase class I/II-fold pyridoxal phosphate-dependent enzyme [Vampirovibrionales bacterium]